MAKKLLKNIKKKIKKRGWIVTTLAAISILGYFYLMFKDVSQLTSQDAWVFIIMGGGLFGFAGGTSIFRIREDGVITPKEYMRVITTVMGGLSFLVGLKILIPSLIWITTGSISALKVPITIISIIFIALDYFSVNDKKTKRR